MKMKLKNQIQHWKSFFRHPMFVLFLICLFAAGCTYYNVKRINDIESDKIRLATELKKKDKYLILQTLEKAYHIQLTELNLDQEFMIVKVFPLPERRGNYKNTTAIRPNRQRADFDPAIQEIHFYTTRPIEAEGTEVKLLFSDLYRVELYEKNDEKTSTMAFFTALGIGAGLVVLIGVAILATKSSCPFVYSLNSGIYEFEGEIYPGAIYKALERDDYLKLNHLVEEDGQYWVKLNNELMERQFTDMFELIEVHHSAEEEVLLDSKGNIQTISHMISPQIAMTGSGADVTSQVEHTDETFFYFNETEGNKGMNELYLSFDKPKDAKDAKLVLYGKNTYWLDYTFGKFYNYFGTYYEKHASLQDESQTLSNIQWAVDQGIRLGVWIYKEDRWVLSEYLEVAGPLSNRKMVVSLDLNGMQGNNIRIKLTSGFMFWELDQIGIDYSDNKEVRVHYLEAIEAIDQDEVNVKKLLIAADGYYLEQPGPGFTTTVSFTPATKPDHMIRSVFLHSRGYYEYIRDYENYPDIITLNKFKKAGAFSEFSRDNYLQFLAKKTPQNSRSL